MPVYEFRCRSCERITEDLYLRADDAPRTIGCPCGLDRAVRIPSRFSVDFTSPGYKALEQQGRIINEPGVDRWINSNARDREAAEDREIERIVDKTLEELPSEIG